MRSLVPATALCLGVCFGASFSASAVDESADYDRELKGARAYLDGWFGVEMALPRIELIRDPGGARIPGHFQGGVVRIDAEALKRTAELRRILRHELTHAVVDSRTAGNCPVWVQEGIAQFLDGTDVVAVDRELARRDRDLVPLLRLEGPFASQDEAARRLAYQESASAVSYLMKRIGRPGLLFIIGRLGEGQPFDRALVEAGLSYSELQKGWEAALGRR